MALQMSLDEISMAKSKNLSTSKDDLETVVPISNVQENTHIKTDIPVFLPK
jgi:hypothetical protein